MLLEYAMGQFDLVNGIGWTKNYSFKQTSNLFEMIVKLKFFQNELYLPQAP